MRYNAIPRTSTKISEVGFGCWTMGGPNWSSDDGQPNGWGEVDRDEVLEAIKIGLDAGVNHFDNADVYGNGRAERLLADCLGSLGHLKGAQRDGLVIATKVGHNRGTASHAYEPHHIRHQCEQSLRNLAIDHIDIYYFHHGSFAPDGEPGNVHEAAETMRALVKEGKVRAVGQSAYSVEDFARAIPVVKPNVLQSWANMLDDQFIRPGCPLQDLMAAHDCTFVAFSPLAQGLLLDKFDPAHPPEFSEGDFRRTQDRFDQAHLRDLKPRLQQIKARLGDATEDLASASIRFVAAHERIASVIPGFRNPRQARCNVRAGADAPMSAEDVEFCRRTLAPAPV